MQKSLNMKISEVPQESFFRSNTTYTHMPGLELGATDSAHQVFFGRDKNNVVAIKPYIGPQSTERASHEEKMLRTIKDLGFLTLEPVCIITTRNGDVAYLLTKYMPNLTTMSSIVQKQTPQVSRLLQATSSTLGAVHAEGVSLGDAQIKNFGVNPEYKRQIAVFDPEKGGTDAIGHKKGDPFLHDVESLVQSLAHKAYGGVITDIAAEKIMNEVIVPYQTVASKGLGSSVAEEIGYRALETHINKHAELHGHRVPVYL